MDLKSRAFSSACCLGAAFVLLGWHFVFTRREDRNGGVLSVAGWAIYAGVTLTLSPVLASLTFALAGPHIFIARAWGAKATRAEAARAEADADIVA